VLLQWPGSMVLVSHDRYFLDRIAVRIWELADQRLEVYRGNYSHYVQQRAARRERQRREWQRQQAFFAKEEDFIRRNIAGQNTRQAQGRRTRLERLRREGGVLERPTEQQAMRLHMEARLRSGSLVLSTQDLVVGYRAATAGDGQPALREEVSGGHVWRGTGQPITLRDTVLFHCQDLELRRGQRVALIGPNGAGKSTLLRTVLGEIAPLAGQLRVGASVRLGYLAQAHAHLLPDMSVLDAILEKAPRMEEGRARSFLGRFLFSGDDVLKPIASLSGGQRSRVALARLTLEGANLLVLDEPTNHLDITSQEVLEEVLRNFSGTVLLVTHDRYLVDAIATQVWSIEDGRLRVFPGNYSQYQAILAEEAEVAEAPANGNQRSESQLQREQAREERRRRRATEQRLEDAQRLEELIAGLEARLQALTEELGRASEAQQLERVQALGVEYQAVDQRLHQLLEEWSALAGQGEAS
jgi:ATP-binding cassette subfamily F protein 3